MQHKKKFRKPEELLQKLKKIKKVFFSKEAKYNEIIVGLKPIIVKVL